MKPKLKLPTIRIKSDECYISVGQVVEDGEIINEGTPYYVHEKEWIEVIPVMTVREVLHLSKLQSGMSNTSDIGENLTMLCQELSKRIVSWNWTDIMGEPLEQPYKNAAVLEEITSEELLWLVGATSQTESTDARKKDSEPLEITS